MHRRDQRQLGEDLVAADIARVQNQLDARECLMDVGPQQTMRIGDESDQDRLILPALPPIPSA